MTLFTISEKYDKLQKQESEEAAIAFTAKGAGGEVSSKKLIVKLLAGCLLAFVAFGVVNVVAFITMEDDKPDYVNGGWSGWGECSKTCEGGVKRRTCMNGSDCAGNGFAECIKDIPCAEKGMPGGFSDAQVDDKVTKAAEEAVTALVGITANTNPVSSCEKNIDLVGVEKVEKQVVRGINYKLTLRLATHTTGNCHDKVEKVCEGITVYEKLPFMCSGDNSNTPCTELTNQQNIKCKDALPTLGPEVYIIAGGYYNPRGIELYHPNIANLQCTITPPPLNRDRNNHVTFYHDNTTYLCGGGGGGDFTATTCSSYNLQMSYWKNHPLSISRYYGHSSVVLKNTLYIIGGVDTGRNKIPAMFTSLPLTSEPNFTPIPNLNYKGYYQCTTEINEDSFIISGGEGGRGFLETVTEYNTKTKTATALPSLKRGRYFHGCVMAEVNNKKWLIVTGGRNTDNGNYLMSTEILEIGKNSWESAGNINVGRVGFSLISTGRGVMAIAGYDYIFADGPINSVELLDWTSKTWKVVEPNVHNYAYVYGGAVKIPSSMFNCEVTLEPTISGITQTAPTELGITTPIEPTSGITQATSNGSVYIIAGGRYNSLGIELYHPSISNLQCSITPPSLKRVWKGHTTFYEDNSIYLCGGSVTASTCYSYNRQMNGWKTQPLSISRFYGHTSAVINNNLYLVGGAHSNRTDAPVITTSLPLTNEPVFTTVPNLNYKGTYPCTTQIDEESFVIIGGNGENGIVDTVIQYNTKTGTVTSLPSLKTGRYKHGCVMTEVNNKKWLIVAGGRGNGNFLTSTEILELGTDSWVSMGDMNAGRTGFSMISAERGVMAIAGYDFVYADYPINSIELLDWTSKTWKVVEPSIQNYANDKFGGAVKIPASMFNCEV